MPSPRVIIKNYRPFFMLVKREKYILNPNEYAKYSIFNKTLLEYDINLHRLNGEKMRFNNV
jgi:hypothetical protein